LIVIIKCKLRGVFHILMNKMDFRELIRVIPKEKRGPFSEKLIDTLLEAQEGEVPPHLAKVILHYWQRDQLDSQAGLIALLEAVAETTPGKIPNVLDEFGLQELSVTYSPLWDKLFF
jgi:hypothetical protein